MYLSPGRAIPIVAQGETLVVLHKSGLTFEPGLILVGAMDDSS